MVSLSSSRRLPATPTPMVVNPVMFPRASAGYQPAPPQSVRNIDKNNGDSFGRVLGGYGRGRIGRDDHVNFKTDQLIGQSRESSSLPSAYRYSKTMFFPSK